MLSSFEGDRSSRKEPEERNIFQSPAHIAEQEAIRAAVLKNLPFEHHDSNTLLKVYDSLREQGLSETTCSDAINSMQNKGILFRERR